MSVDVTMTAPIDGKEVAAVTGAASGIGRATVRRLAEDGFAVIAIDRRTDALQTACAELSARGLDVRACSADVTDRGAIHTALATAQRIDVAVAVAGVYWPTTFMTATEDDFRRMYEVNTIGTFVFMQEAARRMGTGGRIITVSSRAAIGGTNFPHYVASKAAVVGLTRAAAMELRPHGIMVNSVAPGFTDTAMTREMPPDQYAAAAALEPSGKAADPDDIANAIAFFASAHTRFVTGQTLFVDGGKSLGGLAP